MARSAADAIFAVDPGAHRNCLAGILDYRAGPPVRGEAGQAPSYKLGERLWLQLREEARAAEGDGFDLKAFHRRALDIGSVGLDVLRDAVLDRLA